ncbi:MAG: hypothetical protein AAGK21_16645 [Bacteroidota bacterium]
MSFPWIYDALMPRHIVLLAVLAAGSLASAQDASGDRPPVELLQPQPGDGPLSTYLRLLDAEPQYPERSQALSWIHQVLAAEAATLGMHPEALAWMERGLMRSSRDSVGTLPDGTRAVDAVSEIVRLAEDRQVVMVNEAHHDATTRLLTLDLLAPLRQLGFRYLAAETFAPDSVLSRQPGYPTPDAGYYLDEPVFGAVVREALRLGYTLVPYESEIRIQDTTMTRQQWRDSTQAENLAARIFDRDARARVLVHAGYSHVNEEVGRFFHPMARYFRQIMGIDPLTVDQTEVGPMSAPGFEHPAYRAAIEAGLVDDAPVILVDAGGDPLAPIGREVFTDLQVLRPRVDRRPVETLGMGRVRPWEAPARCGRCVVEVRRRDEGPDAVPVDRRVVDSGATVEVYGPRDQTLIVTIADGETGRIVERRFAVAL